MTHVAGQLFRTVDHLRHVLQSHGSAIEDPDDQFGQLLRVAERFARLDSDQLILTAEFAGRLPHVGRLNGTLQLERRNLVCSQAIGIHQDLHDARPTAHDIGARHVLDSSQPLRDLLGHTPQTGVVHGMGRRFTVAGAGHQRQRHNRDVIDLDRLHDPAADTRRHDVEILVHLLVQLDQTAFAVLTHVIPHRDDRLVIAAHRIHILDAVDLIEHLLQRCGDQLFDFGGRVTGEAHIHVRQRHDNLRVFFARRISERRQPDHHCQQDQDDREVRLQEHLDDLIREVV